MPNLNIKFVNVVDLYKLVSNDRHPHGLTHAEYDKLFNPNVPCVFNFHGYPQLIHELTYNRHNDDHMHVRGYMEEGTITTSFDMRVKNKIDRFNLVLLAMKHLKIDAKLKETIVNDMNALLKKHDETIGVTGQDIPEVTEWTWA
jgi:xylulose-5-phosphate/fructose-6-phosphate phosphoketolase